MVRVLEIDIWGQNWDITDAAVDGDKGESFAGKTDAFFGVMRQKSNKITYLYNYTMREEDIVIAKNEGGFYSEQCLFKHDKHTFSGDFIDALLYIQHKLQEAKTS